MMPAQDEHDIIGTKSTTPSISERRDDAPKNTAKEFAAVCHPFSST